MDHTFIIPVYPKTTLRDDPLANLLHSCHPHLTEEDAAYFLSRVLQTEDLEMFLKMEVRRLT